MRIRAKKSYAAKGKKRAFEILYEARPLKYRFPFCSILSVLCDITCPTSFVVQTAIFCYHPYEAYCFSTYEAASCIAGAWARMGRYNLGGTV